MDLLLDSQSFRLDQNWTGCKWPPLGPAASGSLGGKVEIGSIPARAVVILVKHYPCSDQRNREPGEEKRQDGGYKREDYSR